MNKDGKFSLIIKCGCHCAYTNENSDNGNQKAGSEYGVSFNKNRHNHFVVQFISSFTLLQVC